MIQWGNQWKPSTAEFEDPGSLGQELNSDFLIRLDIAPHLQIRDRKYMTGAFASDRHPDQRRSPFPIYHKHGWITAVIAGNHRKGNPLRFRRGSGGRGSLREEGDATHQGHTGRH